MPINKKKQYVRINEASLLIPYCSKRDCIPMSKQAKIRLIRKGVKIPPKKNKIKKEPVNSNAKTRVSSLEKTFFNKKNELLAGRSPSK